MSKISSADLILREVRKADATFRFRKRCDVFHSFIRSCAVCSAFLPPIDFLCENCWRTLGRVINRGEKIRQSDYPFPVYSLMTWTPQNEVFVKPLIYAFKGGHAVQASVKLANLFLSERLAASKARTEHSLELKDTSFLKAPADEFDHSALWCESVSRLTRRPAHAPFCDSKASRPKQKHLGVEARSDRRFEIREHFAGFYEALRPDHVGENDSREAHSSSKRVVFADDVITSGATAMAAYMALGDPSEFEVWTLVARPRLAGKSGLR